MTASAETRSPAGPVSLPGRAEISALRRRYETELLESVVPFWTRHSPDRANGGFWNCLDRDGSLYDTTKYGWLQGRQVWMLAKLYRTVEERPEWLELALSGGRFLREQCLLPGGRVPFSMTADGRAVYVQRKIFTECFYVLALAELSRAADDASLRREAEEGLERIWSWAFDWTKVGRPSCPGETPKRSLAVPMILLNLIDEVTGGDPRRYSPARRSTSCAGPSPRDGTGSTAASSTSSTPAATRPSPSSGP
jgi:N-acylglucosamine 2-epimerase